MKKPNQHVLKRSLFIGLALSILGSGVNMSDASAKTVASGFDLQAHRGGRDLWPEDTLPAFAHSLELGVTTLEMDVQLTKDGRLVVSHNPKLEPILAKDANGNYVTKENKPDMRTMTLKQIKTYDVGAINPAEKEYYAEHALTQKAIPGTRIATLEEVFELVNAYGNSTVLFNIETKSYAAENDPDFQNNPCPEEFVRKLLSVIKKYNMQDRVTIQSFDWRTLQETRRLDKEMTTVALTRRGYYTYDGQPGCSPWMGGIDIDDYNGDYVLAAHAIFADVISPRQDMVDAASVAQAHKLGMKMIPWTVNKKEDMIRLIDLGVDGIISDRPDILRQVLLEKGLPVAEPTARPTGLAKQFPASVNW